MKETIEKALNRIAVSMEARKREQQLAGVFLKPISKRAKKLLEKIVANKAAYPVYVTVGDDKGDTITICENCNMATAMVFLVYHAFYILQWSKLFCEIFSSCIVICRCTKISHHNKYDFVGFLFDDFYFLSIKTDSKE